MYEKFAYFPKAQTYTQFLGVYKLLRSIIIAHITQCMSVGLSFSSVPNIVETTLENKQFGGYVVRVSETIYNAKCYSYSTTQSTNRMVNRHNIL